MPPKSTVWQHFVKNSDQSGTCRYCGKVLKTKGNTSNLKCHLQSKHQTIFSQFEKSLKTMSCSTKPSNEISSSSSTTSLSLVDSVSLPITPKPCCSNIDSKKQTTATHSALPCSRHQDTISDAFKKVESFKEGGCINTKITQAIIYMICKDYQPLSIVEHTGFNKLIKTIAPQYKMPSRFTIKRLIMDKFDLLSTNMKQTLVDKKCTLTTDIWTDPQTRSFISVTVHFYDENNDRLIFSGTIGVFMIEDRHTGEKIANELKLVCTEWNISHENVIAVVTDNAANITLAIEIGFGKNKHIPCFAHTLNLVIEKGLANSQEATNLIFKIKSIVSWFKHSVVASDELRRKTEKKLIQSVETRWNSVYYMIDRFLELRPIVNEIVNQYTSAPPMLNAAEIEVLKEIKDILEPLEAATTEISGQHYVTGSVAIPIANITKRKLNSLNLTTEVGKSCLKEVIGQYNKRFSNIEQVHLLAVATLLDPRFKKMYFENPVAYSKHVTFINNTINKMDKELTDKKLSTDSSSDSEPDKIQKKRSLFSEHNKTVQKNGKNKRNLNLVVRAN